MEPFIFAGVVVIILGVAVIFSRFKKGGALSQKEEQPMKQHDLSPSVSNEIDEGELVAILTAAIAASLQTSTYHLQIKSYRRIGNQAPVWNQAGVVDTMQSRCRL